MAADDDRIIFVNSFSKNWAMTGWRVGWLRVHPSLQPLFENLIQLVNIVGSIFYGTVLGIFLVGFYIKYIKAGPIFWGAVVSQLLIFYIYYLDAVSFLWLNFIGAMLTILLSFSLQLVWPKKKAPESAL